MNSNDILDPVVERARQAREALAKECSCDLDKMAELFKAMQAEHPERLRDPRASAIAKRPLGDARPTRPQEFARPHHSAGMQHESSQALAQRNVLSFSPRFVILPCPRSRPR